MCVVAVMGDERIGETTEDGTIVDSGGNVTRYRVKDSSSVVCDDTDSSDSDSDSSDYDSDAASDRDETCSASIMSASMIKFLKL